MKELNFTRELYVHSSLGKLKCHPIKFINHDYIYLHFLSLRNTREREDTLKKKETKWIKKNTVTIKIISVFFFFLLSTNEKNHGRH